MVIQFVEFFHQHLILFGAFIVTLALLIANELHGVASAGKRLSTTEAVRMINDRDAIVVDVRTAAEFKKGHLLGAIHIPAAKIAERAGELGKDHDKPVIVYCAMGSRSLEAAKLLRAHGFTEVYPMRGGINRWQTDNLPVTVK